MDKPTITALGLAILAIIVAIAPNLIDSETAYVCLEPKLAMECDSLSAINDDGLVTRCYFFSEELNRTTHKNCGTGWLKYDKPIEEIVKLDLDKDNPIYLLCDKDYANGLIKECQVIDKNETVYMID